MTNSPPAKLDNHFNPSRQTINQAYRTAKNKLSGKKTSSGKNSVSCIAYYRER